MADEEFPPEDELESRQAAGLYPVGRALRATYDAENHDSLGPDLTGLMLELARVDPEAPPPPKVVLPHVEPPQATPTAQAPEPGRASWWRRLLG